MPHHGEGVPGVFAILSNCFHCFPRLQFRFNSFQNLLALTLVRLRLLAAFQKVQHLLSRVHFRALIFHQAFQLLRSELVFIFIHALALEDADKTYQQQRRHTCIQTDSGFSHIRKPQFENYIQNHCHTYTEQTEFQAGIDLFLPGCPLLIQILHHRM